MKRKEFQNLPSTETPINAENLNEMQSNIEESCVAVSPTEPTTNEKVWIDNVNQKIYVKNDNGAYEEFISKPEPINITTGVERATNEYIDGKQVYRKRIDVGYLPNATTKKVATELTNVTYVKLEGFGSNGAGRFFLIPIVENSSASSYNTSLMVYNNEIWITCDNNQSNNYGWVDLYYTKN